jgi:hypothetical protein
VVRGKIILNGSYNIFSKLWVKLAISKDAASKKFHASRLRETLISPIVAIITAAIAG